MVVMVVIKNSKGKFLMQKRIKSKGGDWGVTGGHPKANETLLEGIVTKVKEELTEVRWFSIDELKNMVRTKELNEDQISCFIKVCKFLEENK